jgi:hypothetical protein
MASIHLRTASLLIAGLALTAAPSFADHGHRGNDGRSSGRNDGQSSRRNDGQSSGRAIESRRAVEAPRVAVESPRVNESRRARADSAERSVPRGGFSSRSVIVPRVIRPSIVNIVPYRPYYYTYRPGVSLYYGRSYGYADPYGYYAAPPPGYLYAVPGRPYGGVRIQDAPGDAEVFADGYYMGTADDFDGVFQHMNLEAGPHHIEIRAPGYEPIEFDVRVEPGQTITYRAYLPPLRP